MMSGSRNTKRVIENYNKLSLDNPSISIDSETDDDDDDATLPLPRECGGGMKKRALSKQLSMRDVERELKWEKRKRQMYLRSQSRKIDGVVELRDNQGNAEEAKERERRRERVRSLTDEDLDELRGCIELGFDFDEDNGGRDLCKTLPALNLYFAVKRQLSEPKLQLSPSPASTPSAMSSASTLSGTASPRSPLLEGGSENTWKVYKPGDSPQQVKTRLRHWAQAVALSVRQCY